MNRLRTLEATALLATVLAFGVTALLEPASAAIESNGVAATLLATVGWAPAGVLAVCVEGAIFAGYWRIARAGYDRTALAGGGLVVLVGIGDLVWNGFVLAQLGVPETVRAGKYGLAVGCVAVAALAVYYRREGRVLAATLVSVSGRVTRRLSKPDLSAARSVLLVAMLVLAAVSGAVTFGPLPAADRASAADTVEADVEEGDLSDFSSVGTYWSAASGSSIEGTYWAKHSPGGGSSIRITDVPSNPSSVEYRVRFSSFSDVDWEIQLNTLNSANSRMANVEILADGSVYASSLDGGGKDTGIDLQTGTNYLIRFKKINYSADTYTLVIRGGSTDFSKSYNFRTSADQISEISAASGGGATWYTDYWTTGGVGIGTSVSGTITGSDGNAITDTTVELRQSGTVIQTTTTASDGSYSFSAVSDGDYSIRASAPGYQNASKSITVSGSPVTVDFKLYETGTFVREF